MANALLEAEWLDLCQIVDREEAYEYWQIRRIVP
jgi:hypothetical protein